MNYNIGKQNTEKNHVLDASGVAIKALWIALVFLATRFLQFPIPLGYAHLGNAMILLAAVYFGPVTGMLAGGLGSALADLTSFPAWTLPTLIIKLLMGLICGIIAGKPKSGKPRTKQLPVLIAVVVTIAEMVFGYFVAGSILYSSVATGLLQVPGLTAEGIVGIILFYLLGSIFDKRKGV